jgi:hypothetical protein
MNQNFNLIIILLKDPFKFIFFHKSLKWIGDFQIFIIFLRKKKAINLNVIFYQLNCLSSASIPPLNQIKSWS